jgi:hypothetical protein
MPFIAVYRLNSATRYKMIGERRSNSGQLLGRLGNQVGNKELPSGNTETIVAVVVDRPVGN